MSNKRNYKRRNKKNNGSKPAFAQGKRRPNRKRPGRKPSTLDPQLLIKKAVAMEEESYYSQRTIAELPVNPQLRSRLLNKGFERPTEIQDKTLESLLDGRDLLGIAQTGTGKTGAFLIPIIEELLQNPRVKTHSLVVVPTRELAKQVEEEFRSMTKNLKLFSASFIGGTNINTDLRNLRRSPHIVIGTPGRLLDLYSRRALQFDRFHTLVLDEFDRMLDMGFAREMDQIIGAMNNRKQTMLFSATLDKAQESRIGGILNDPVTIKVSSGEVSGDQIDQDIIRLHRNEDKFLTLTDMLNEADFTKVLVFEETKYKVRRLNEKLRKAGVRSDEIHGNKSQAQRQQSLKAFKAGRIQVLVATDVAARGIDVGDVSHVINYQLPTCYTTYIHRIGRTGRAGKVGKAYTFVA